MRQRGIREHLPMSSLSSWQFAVIVGGCLFLMASPLVIPLTPTEDVVSVVSGGAILGWVLYLRQHHRSS